MNEKTENVPSAKEKIQGKIPGMKFVVAIFMEEELTTESFVDAVSYLFRRVMEEAKDGIRRGFFSTFWIECWLNDNSMGSLRPSQVADISRAIGIFTTDNKLATVVPPIDDSELLRQLLLALGESRAALAAHRAGFKKLYDTTMAELKAEDAKSSNDEETQQV